MTKGPPILDAGEGFDGNPEAFRRVNKQIMEGWKNLDKASKDQLETRAKQMRDCVPTAISETDKEKCVDIHLNRMWYEVRNPLSCAVFYLLLISTFMLSCLH